MLLSHDVLHLIYVMQKLRRGFLVDRRFLVFVIGPGHILRLSLASCLCPLCFEK